MKNNGFFARALSFGLTFVLAGALLPAPDAAARETMQKETKEAGADNTHTEAGETGADNAHAETGEAGTEHAPEEEILWETIEIDSAEDFLSFAGQCSLDSWSGDKLILLNADISLSDADFESVPIFTGIFDGKGHTISGFQYDGDGYVAGLFRYIGKNGVVKNLNVAGELTVSGEKECIGGLAGVNYGTIQNCSFRGTAGGKTSVGGLVGVNEGTGTIQDCHCDGHVTGYYSTGGIAGTNHGALLRCTNRAGINNDSQWVEEDDEMGTGIFFSLSVEDSGTELFSGVDAGGIAGYSDGVITACKNYGTVGYEHTGYNIGGIAGRQCGILSLCDNSGTIYGRKDIGGIVGQMEPYIETNEAESLRDAVNKLHDLIEKTIDDMEAGKNASRRDLDNLAAYSDGAADAGNALAGQIEDFVDGNMDQTQAVADRLDNVEEMLPPIFDKIYAAQDSFADVGASLKQIGEALKNTGSAESAQKLENASERADAAVQDILNGPNTTIGQLDELELSLAEMSDAAYAGLDDLNGISKGQTEDSLGKIGDQLSAAMTHLQNTASSLKTAARDTKSIIDYVNGQPDIRFSKLGDTFTENRENLHSQLRMMSQSLQNLSRDVSNYSDAINNDLRAVNDQLNLVFNLLTDSLTNYGELDVEELYEDVDIEDADDITSGKTDNCTNRGVVQGDINVGGIAGAMSIDEEDPEDNAAGSVNYQVGRRYFTKCVITGCVNEGYITAKKDGVGGIAGYMKHGSILDSEGCGSVESTEGNYAGGICGESLTAIRRCYALCSVSGNQNVGGIAGYADTLTDCCSMADCTAGAGKTGAIAGQIADYEDALNGENSKVSGNYYVSDTLCGIDNISYTGVAEPLSYGELLSISELPAAFRHLKVIFRIEDSCLGEQEVPFGESLSCLKYPEIPEKKGYYGVWPDCSDKVMSGNLLITGEYRENVTVVQSEETREAGTDAGHGKPYALIEQRFTEDTILNVSIGGAAPPERAADRQYVIYDISLENAGIDASDSFAVRLYNPYDEDAEVWEYGDGVWRKSDSKARGRYLQIDMTGTKRTFCVMEHTSDNRILFGIAAGALLFVLLAVLLKKCKRTLSRRKKEKETKENHNS